MGTKARQRRKTAQFASGVDGEWLVTKLPSCLIMEILSRLPIQTLSDCRCVCKTWLHFISDPHFSKLQLQRSPPGFLIKIDRSDESRHLQLVLLTEENTKGHVGFEKLKINCEIGLPSYVYYVIRSCNGLLCWDYPSYSNDDFVHNYDFVHVCNPMLGEFITIPLTNDDDDNWKCYRSFGFGFCDATNEYKVVQTYSIKKKSDNKLVEGYEGAEIYTIGKGEWKSLGIAPSKINIFDPNSASLNGCIHWIDYCSKDKIRTLYSFNFSSEQFKLVSLPSVLDTSDKKFEGSLFLGVWKGCLYASMGSVGKEREIWVMKEYGIKESWTKMLVVEASVSFYTVWQPLVEFDCENMLMLCNTNVIVSYNTKTKKFHDFKIAKNSVGWFSIISHTPSFISLKDIAKAEEVKITRHRRDLNTFKCDRQGRDLNRKKRKAVIR